MKRYVRIMALTLAVAMLACGSGCGKKGGDMPGGMMGEQEETVTNVELANPTVGSIKDEYMYSGTIQAAEAVGVTAKVQGTVAATYYEVGDKVTKGSVLYKIDDTDYQNALKSAQAGLASANAGVASAQTGVATANGSSVKTQLESSKTAVTNCETSLENAQKSLDDAKITLDKAQNDYDINKQLNEVGGISDDVLNTYKNNLETATNAYSRAQNAVKSAEDALAQAKTSYNILEKETTAENTRRANDSLTSAKASQNSASVAVSTAQQQIEYCTVTSPIDGVVLSKNVTTGAMASGVGYQIVDLSAMKVEVNVSEQIATSVNVGDEVTIEIPSLSADEQFSGSITELAPGANTDGTYTVKINIPNANGDLIAGMFAKVYFAKSTSNAALILTRDAVLVDNDQYYVYVTEDGSTAKRVDVEIGIDTGETIEVTSGLTKNDRVVVKGQTYLADGGKIKVVAENGVSTSQEASNEQNTEAAQPADGKEAKK
jgi:RND family efflux transporter MFP subunit